MIRANSNRRNPRPNPRCRHDPRRLLLCLSPGARPGANGEQALSLIRTLRTRGYWAPEDSQNISFAQAFPAVNDQGIEERLGFYRLESPQRAAQEPEVSP